MAIIIIIFTVVDVVRLSHRFCGPMTRTRVGSADSENRERPREKKIGDTMTLYACSAWRDQSLFRMGHVRNDAQVVIPTHCLLSAYISRKRSDYNITIAVVDIDNDPREIEIDNNILIYLSQRLISMFQILLLNLAVNKLSSYIYYFSLHVRYIRLSRVSMFVDTEILDEDVLWSYY